MQQLDKPTSLVCRPVRGHWQLLANVRILQASQWCLHVNKHWQICDQWAHGTKITSTDAEYLDKDREHCLCFCKILTGNHSKISGELQSRATRLTVQNLSPYIPWGDELFWYPSWYLAAGTELIQKRWSTQLCCLSVLKQLYFFYFVRIRVRLGSKCRAREMKFCMSYWGDTTVYYNSFSLCSTKPAGPSIEQNLAANE